MQGDTHRLALWSLLAVAGAISPAGAQPAVAHGKAIVETNCARCHAIGTKGESTHADAPPFRTLSSRYPIDALEEALAEGISTGHPDMPQFVATPEQIKAIIAYITSIQNH